MCCRVPQLYDYRIPFRKTRDRYGMSWQVLNSLETTSFQAPEFCLMVPLSAMSANFSMASRLKKSCNHSTVSHEGEMREQSRIWVCSVLSPSCPLLVWILANCSTWGSTSWAFHFRTSPCSRGAVAAANGCESGGVLSLTLGLANSEV